MPMDWMPSEDLIFADDRFKDVGNNIVDRVLGQAVIDKTAQAFLQGLPV